MFMPEISNRMVFVNGKHPKSLLGIDREKKQKIYNFNPEA